MTVFSALYTMHFIISKSVLISFYLSLRYILYSTTIKLQLSKLNKLNKDYILCRVFPAARTDLSDSYTASHIYTHAHLHTHTHNKMKSCMTSGFRSKKQETETENKIISRNLSSEQEETKEEAAEMPTQQILFGQRQEE